jgi:hypothetical protein
MEMEIVESVKAKYGAVAQSSLSNDHAGVRAVAQAFGYSVQRNSRPFLLTPIWGSPAVIQPPPHT